MWVADDDDDDDDAPPGGDEVLMLAIWRGEQELIEGKGSSVARQWLYAVGKDRRRMMAVAGRR